jgi:hypothetical protein
VLKVEIKRSKNKKDGSYHLECFGKNKDELGFDFKAEE